jgi:hypothetical protein
MAKRIINNGTPPLKWSKITDAITDINANFDELFLAVGGEGVSLENLSSTVAPSSTDTYDLGTEARRWRNLYLSGDEIKLGSAVIGTIGSVIDLPAGSTINGTPISDVAGQDGPAGPAGPAGPQGEQGPAGPQGEQGPAGPAGAPGTSGEDGLGILEVDVSTGDLIITYSDSTVVNAGNVQGPQGEQGPAGPAGATGPAGPTGATGATGADGTSVQLKGAVATVLDLDDIVSPEVGDLYVVTATGDGYVWDGEDWANAGPIRGPAGPQGDPGPEGPQGEPGPEGPEGPAGIANSFTTIAVSGQSDVVADSNNDILTLIAGTNVTITTNATNDSLTINASGDGTVNTGTATQLAFYPSSTAAVSATGSGLTWNSGTSTLTATNLAANSIQSNAVGVPTLESATDIVLNPVGDIRVSSKKITELTTPTADTDAANKVYVDTRTFSLGATSVQIGSTVGTISGLTSVSSGNFTGSLTGNASSASVATTVTLSPTTTNAVHYLTFVDTATGNEDVRTDVDLSYNPSTNVLTAGVFNGSGASLTSIPNGALTNSSITVGSTNISLGGTATTIAGLSSVTSTTFVGALTGNASTATTATAATTVTLTAVSGPSSTHFLLFADGSTGNEDVRATNTLTYIPNTGTLSSTVFSGSLTGNADTATTAASATTVALTATNTTAASHFITFVDSATGNENVRTDTDLTYNPSTNTLTAGTFSGALSGNATTATTATAATTVTLVATNNPVSATYYPIFVEAATGNEEARTDTGLSYNPNTNTLTTATFSGALSGNANTATTAGTVTTAAQPSITSVGSLTGLTVNGNTSIQSIFERATVTASAISSSTNIDISTAAVVYFSVDATSNWTLNFRGNLSTTLNSIVSTGQSVTVAVLVKQGATPYYPTSHSIDGTGVTPLWQNGLAASAGNANGVDIYTYTIIKTGAGTYTVFASQTRFA